MCQRNDLHRVLTSQVNIIPTPAQTANMVNTDAALFYTVLYTNNM